MPPKPSQKLNKIQLIGTILTLSNTMMGAALLSLPYTFARLGWPLAVCIAIFAFTFSTAGFSAIIDASHYSRASTMRGMIRSIFGNIVATIIDACIAFMYCGYLVSYVSICSDYLVVFVKAVSQYDFDAIYMKIVLFIPLAPMTMLSSPGALSNVSAFAIIFIFLTVCACFSYFMIGIKEGSVPIVVNGALPIRYPLTNPLDLVAPAHKRAGYAILEFIQRIPLFMPLFGCHASIPVLLHDLMGEPNYRRELMKKACFYASCLVSVLYLINAFSCYFLFGRNIAGNVLLSFAATNYIMTTVRLLYAFVIILSYVVIVYPIRAIFMDWFKLDRTSKKGKLIFYLIGVLLTVFAIGASIAVPNIVVVFNSVAALFGIAVYWIIPLIARWKLPELRLRSMVPEIDDPEQQVRASIDVRRMSLINVVLTQNQMLNSIFDLEKRVRTRSEVKNEILDMENRERSHTLRMDFGNVQVVQVEEKRARAHSIAETLPTQVNDQVLEIQAAIQAAVEVKSEANGVDLEIKKIMTKSRLIKLVVASVVIVCINLTAFVLSTFFDMAKVPIE